MHSALNPGLVMLILDPASTFGPLGDIIDISGALVLGDSSHLRHYRLKMKIVANIPLTYENKFPFIPSMYA